MDTIQPDVPQEHLGDPPLLGEYAGFEIYAMPAFVRFHATDPSVTADWYVNALGFGVMYVGPELEGRPMLVHLRRRKYQDILLVPGAPEQGGVSLDATGELDALASRSASYTSHEGPVQTSYGPRELTLEDPDGHILTLFAAPDEPGESIDDVMDRAASAARPRSSGGLDRS
jgi:hypothetical protein